MSEKERIKNFVAVPRSLRDAYANGEMTKNQFFVLLWIWLNTNPVNGFLLVSYEGLLQDLRDRTMSYVNVRRIFSSLLSAQLIYYLHHKGRGGSFAVYPVSFLLTNGKIQTWEYLKSNKSITTSNQGSSQPLSEVHHNFDPLNHNFENLKNEKMKLIEKRKM